jgi:hypothetical protein
VAEAAHALSSPFHADRVLVAQPGRAFLRRDYAKAHPARRLQERHRPGSRHPQSYLAEHNDHPKPFVWTAKATDIIEKVRRGKQALESEH